MLTRPPVWKCARRQQAFLEGFPLVVVLLHTISCLAGGIKPSNKPKSSQRASERLLFGRWSVLPLSACSPGIPRLVGGDSASTPWGHRAGPIPGLLMVIHAYLLSIYSLGWVDKMACPPDVILNIGTNAAPSLGERQQSVLDSRSWLLFRQVSWLGWKCLFRDALHHYVCRILIGMTGCADIAITIMQRDQLRCACLSQLGVRQWACVVESQIV